MSRYNDLHAHARFYFPLLLSGPPWSADDAARDVGGSGEWLWSGGTGGLVWEKRCCWTRSRGGKETPSVSFRSQGQERHLLLHGWRSFARRFLRSQTQAH